MDNLDSPYYREAVAALAGLLVIWLALSVPAAVVIGVLLGVNTAADVPAPAGDPAHELVA